MKYLTAEQVLFIHSRIIDESGGAHGVRDVGLLKSAIGRPRTTFDGRDLYPEIFRKSAALMESLIKNHSFIDGNKRTAVASASLFLRQNGLPGVEATQQEIETFTLNMALKKISTEKAAEWLRKHSPEMD